MTPDFIELRNPHHPNENNSIKEISLDGDIWSMFVNPERISFIRTVVTGEADSCDMRTEMCVDGHIFILDCTPEALFDSIFNRQKSLRYYED